MADTKNLLFITDIKLESYGIRLFFHPLQKNAHITLLKSYDMKDLTVTSSSLMLLEKKTDNVLLKFNMNNQKVYEDLIQEKGSAKNDEDLMHLIPKVGEPFAKIIQILD